VEAPALSPETVTRLAEIVGIPLADAAVAERIAAGARAAIEVVRECVAAESSALFEHEPGDFLAALERLADPESNPK
jgi:hypothetical protein